MSAEIVQFSLRRPPEKFGPREALIDSVMDANDVMTAGVAGHWADWLLMALDLRGFKIVSVESTE